MNTLDTAPDFSPTIDLDADTAALARIPAAPAPAPVVRFVGDRPRTFIVPLEWPVEVDGVVHTEVTVRRLTAQEVATFIEQLRAEPDRSIRWPMYDVPDAVIDALDDDDAFALNQAVTDFLPRRFREQGGSTPSTGSGTVR